MWFDVKAALAEIDRQPGPRVAHVAHVARRPAQKSKNVAWPTHVPGLVTHALDDVTPDERIQGQVRATIEECDAGLTRPKAERCVGLALVGGTDWRDPEGMT